ncbi:MAG TPA: DUF4124 domain-containing protein [Rhodocyclaceae bacterium]
MRLRQLAPLVFALCSMVASAQMYSWKDANGKVHYSDEPPPDKTPARKVAAPASGPGDPNASRALAEQEAASRKKQKEGQDAAAKAAKEKAASEERAAECERARANLQSIESGQTRFTIDAKGERMAMDGDAREAELARARRAVEANCK